MREMKMNSVDKVLEGDVLAAARLMRGIEDELPDALEQLQCLYLHTGRAYIVGIAGAPGAGKSTLLDRLISSFRKKDMTVGVIAIDPSSHFTGGALLGDRIRMQSYGVDKDVFIRSLATRGWKGGLSKATINMIHVMDAMGKDVIFVEAVGSGQGEIDIARVADTSIIVLTPGMGDEVQSMKAGILEAADILAINKADREGAQGLKNVLEAMVALKSCAPDSWRPCVLLTEALFDKGTEELVQASLQHKEFLISSGQLEERRKERAKLELLWAVESSLMNSLERMDKDFLAKLVDDLVCRRTNPQSAASKIINLPKGV